MKLLDIRAEFLDFFAQNNHKILPSSSLIPHNDPSLMFVNAGMVPFKNYFTGLEKPAFEAVATAQKCLRAGGKHNDLDNVGYTARHHTFFEMLGNFSFSKYFKEEAIYYAYQFLTKNLGLPKSKLLFTVFHTDDEAFSLWKKIASVADDKIIRIKTNDNFWSMGDIGPCGPCSEIFYDHGDHIKGNPPGSSDEGDRFIEIWNLVFMQYEQKKDGSKIDLPNPAIDTGMGLERVAAILQNKHNNFEIDLFADLIKESQKLANNSKDIASHRIIADHLRASSFLLADGIIPENEGRGYVLRRIMRRAMRHIHQMGASKHLLSDLFPFLEEKMASYYVELSTSRDFIIENIYNEEKQFSKTLAKGMKILDEEIVKKKGGKFSGKTAFKLYDTYGFPIDLTADILKNQNIFIDYEDFNQKMAEQKSRGKENWQGSGHKKDDNIWFEIAKKLQKTEFTGYDNFCDESEILFILDEDLTEQKFIKELEKKYYIITKKTPFYAESGGQIGDSGVISLKNSEFLVQDTKKFAKNLIVHIGFLAKGEFRQNEKISLLVDAKRQDIKKNHSATHLLHKALQEILGAKISQKGSMVNNKILRFDFSYNKQVAKDDLLAIEQRVNEIILQNGKVKTEIMTIEKAKKSGAMALFGEKYNEKVRVLTMGKDKNKECFSKELCGGTHINRTGDIGIFKIISENSVASGIRRIEAITGKEVLKYMQNQETILNNLTQLSKSSPAEISVFTKNLIDKNKKISKEIASLKLNSISAVTQDEIIDFRGKKIIFKILQDVDSKSGKNLVFNLREKEVFDLMVILASFENKISIWSVSKDTENFKSNKIIKKLVFFLDGKGGGGSAEFAQGGASNIDKLSIVKKNFLAMI